MGIQCKTKKLIKHPIDYIKRDQQKKNYHPYYKNFS